MQRKEKLALRALWRSVDAASRDAHKVGPAHKLYMRKQANCSLKSKTKPSLNNRDYAEGHRLSAASTVDEQRQLVRDVNAQFELSETSAQFVLQVLGLRSVRGLATVTLDAIEQVVAKLQTVINPSAIREMWRLSRTMDGMPLRNG